MVKYVSINSKISATSFKISNILTQSSIYELKISFYYNIISLFFYLGSPNWINFLGTSYSNPEVLYSRGYNVKKTK